MSGGGSQSNFFPNRPGINLPLDPKEQQDGYRPKPILQKKVLCLFGIFLKHMIRYRDALQMGLVFWSVFLLEGFNFKKEDRFDCGVKAGDAFVSQRRFPQQLYWDYKVKAVLYKSHLPTSQMLLFKEFWTLSLSLFLAKFDRWKGWDTCSFLWQMWTAS